MPHLPAYTDKPKSALEQFIHDNEPAGKKEAREFRQGLIAVLNAVSINRTWSEHPDSLYAEESYNETQ